MCRAVNLSGAAVLLVIASLGCAKNPVTDKTQFMVVSQEKEIRVGEEACQEIKKEFGYYDEQPGLNGYVNEVGERLVAQSERRDLVYHFQVLNTPVINAFALPGGYIFVTRGLLARLNSEDELAAVLGHELTHVAARHSAAMLSKAYATQTAMILASLFYPAAMGAVGNLANIALNLAFLGYSRAMERQADDHGISYMERVGYHPEGALQTFQMFKRLEQEEPGKMERFLLSHPPTKERITYAQQRVEKMRATEPARFEKAPLREAYLAKIEGLLMGQADGEKIVLSNVFYHKHYGLSFTFPDAYAARLNPPDGEVLLFRDVQDGPQEADASETPEEEGKKKRERTRRQIIALEVRQLHRPGQTLPEFIQEYLKSIKRATSVKGTEEIQTAEGLPLTLKTIDFGSNQGPVRCLAGFYLQGKNGFVLYGYCLQKNFERMRPEFLETIRSLRFPPEDEMRAATPYHLRLHKTGEGETWATLALDQMGSADLAKKLALFNGFSEPGTAPPVGTLLKIPSRQALVSKES